MLASLVSTRVTLNKNIRSMRARSTANKVQALGGNTAEVPATQTKWIDPAFHNKNMVRALVIVGTVAAASKGAVFLPAAMNVFLHVTATAIWFGTNFWTTFIAGITMFKNLPRQMFGRVQSRLFPAYFQLSAACLLLMIGTALAAGLPVDHKQIFTLGVALALVAVNLFVVEPETTKMMFERYELENTGQGDSDRCKELRKKFGAAHGISSLVNLGATVIGFQHIWWLASKVVLTLA